MLASPGHRPGRLLPQRIRPGVPGDGAAAPAGDVLRLPAVAGRRASTAAATSVSGSAPACSASPTQRRPPHPLAGQGAARPRGSGPTHGPTTRNCSPGVDLAIWLDSAEEAVSRPDPGGRVHVALDHPAADRPLRRALARREHPPRRRGSPGSAYEGPRPAVRPTSLAERGRLSCPFGSTMSARRARAHVTGDLILRLAATRPRPSACPGSNPRLSRKRPIRG